MLRQTLFLTSVSFARQSSSSQLINDGSGYAYCTWTGRIADGLAPLACLDATMGFDVAQTSAAPQCAWLPSSYRCRRLIDSKI